MQVGWFESPVHVELSRGARIRAVTNAREAAECLLYQWPCPCGRGHRHARMACMSVLQGDKSAHYAQRAFLEAAREACILLEETHERREPA